jgi:DNA polymerase-3 subunit alpha
VEWTYGQIVYQEQIMWILRDVAGFDVSKVLRVRKIIGKKLGEFQFAELWEDFKQGCFDKCGLGSAAAERMWGSITTAAGYAFNTAHAYSYALIAWQQMYFKIYHKTNVFYAASLAKNGDGKDDLPRRTALLTDAERKGLTVLPVLIEASDLQWKPNHPDFLLPGLMQLPKVGPATAEDLISWRVNLPFQDYDNLNWDGAARPASKGGCNGIGPTTVENIKRFVGSNDPFRVHATAEQLDTFRQQLDNGEFDGYGLPSSEEFVGSSFLSEAPSGTDHVAFVGLVANIVERDEIESKRQRTGQSAAEIRAGMDAPEKSKKATIFAYDEFGEVALRVSRFRYPHLAEKISLIKPDWHIVVGWGRTFDGKARSIQLINLWILDPD